MSFVFRISQSGYWSWKTVEYDDTDSHSILNIVGEYPEGKNESQFESKITVKCPSSSTSVFLRSLWNLRLQERQHVTDHEEYSISAKTRGGTLQQSLERLFLHVNSNSIRTFPHCYFHDRHLHRNHSSDEHQISLNIT